VGRTDSKPNTQDSKLSRPKAATPADSGKLIATEPINAGSGIALADGESYDVTMTLASEP